MHRTKAPAWAGYVAALFGLEYALAKAVMAARGELGVPGHAAPAEAYEDFSGSVVAAQLGSAALGLLSAAVALALVQRWGRHIPSAVLAGGATAALLGGIAGTVVVATSLVGVREDHGQWGLDSLMLGLAPLPAWLVLTRAALGAIRVNGPPTWLRPGRRAAVAAAAASAAYAALKLQWALGGELLMRQTPLPDDARRDLLAREPSAVASHWAAVALGAAGVALAVATVRSRRLPRLVTIGMPALLAVLMATRAGWGAASDAAVLTGAAEGSSYSARWDLALWSPFFAAWAVAWGAAARGAASNSRAAPRRSG
jgi:hypothetical protein